MSAAAACTSVVVKDMQTIAATMSVLGLLFIVVAFGVDHRQKAEPEAPPSIPHGERTASPKVGAGEFQGVPQKPAAETLSNVGAAISPAVVQPERYELRHGSTTGKSDSNTTRLAILTVVRVQRSP